MSWPQVSFVAEAEFEAEVVTALQGWHPQAPRGAKGCLRGWWHGGSDVTGDDFWRNPHFLVTEVKIPPTPPPPHPYRVLGFHQTPNLKLKPQSLYS